MNTCCTNDYKKSHVSDVSVKQLWCIGFGDCEINFLKHSVMSYVQLALRESKVKIRLAVNVKS